MRRTVVSLGNIRPRGKAPCAADAATHLEPAVTTRADRQPRPEAGPRQDHGRLPRAPRTGQPGAPGAVRAAPDHLPTTAKISACRTGGACHDSKQATSRPMPCQNGVSSCRTKHATEIPPVPASRRHLATLAGSATTTCVTPGTNFSKTARGRTSSDAPKPTRNRRSHHFPSSPYTATACASTSLGQRSHATPPFCAHRSGSGIFPAADKGDFTHGFFANRVFFSIPHGRPPSVAGQDDPRTIPRSRKRTQGSPGRSRPDAAQLLKNQVVGPFPCMFGRLPPPRRRCRGA